MFGLLFSGLLHGAAAIGKYIKDKDYMSSPVYYENGTPVYIDSSGRKYMNGEKVETKYDYKNGGLIEVGSRSGTVYFSQVDAKAKRMHEQYDIPNLKQAERRGELACNLWYPQYDKMLTTEISTGKIISCLYRDIYTDECRKFYYKGGYQRFIENGCFRTTQPGDMGIVITREEYDKLNISGNTCAMYPCDDTYYELERISEEKRKK